MTRDPHGHLRPFFAWQDAFSEDELDAIEAWCDARLAHGGSAQLPNEPGSELLYRRAGFVIGQVNDMAYGFDIQGLLGNFEIQARGPQDSDASWRSERIREGMQRKLCFTLQLSRPGQVQGGQLLLNGEGAAKRPPMDRGAVAVFPFYTLVHMTPVISGVRKSATIWAGGPQLR